MGCFSSWVSHGPMMWCALHPKLGASPVDHPVQQIQLDGWLTNDQRSQRTYKTRGLTNNAWTLGWECAIDTAKQAKLNVKVGSVKVDPPNGKPFVGHWKKDRMHDAKTKANISGCRRIQYLRKQMFSLLEYGNVTNIVGWLKWRYHAFSQQEASSCLTEILRFRTLLVGSTSVLVIDCNWSVRTAGFR